MRESSHLTDIQAYFATAIESVFRPKDLETLLVRNRQKWRIPKSHGQEYFLDLLQEKVGLKKITLLRQGAKPIVRFLRGVPTHLELGASIEEGSYFCHQTAAVIHSFLQIVPKVIYLNKEQAKSPNRPT